MSMTEHYRSDLRRMMPVAARAEEHEALEDVVRAFGAFDRLPALADRCELVGPSGERIELPASLFQVLRRVAEVLARGDAVTLVPVGKLLTTQQAANILNVSRQYLVRLLDDGIINFSRTGTHRRVKAQDVIAYKARRDRERKAKLDDLTQLTEELGGYEELE